MTDDQILQLLFDRTVRRPAPEALHPTGRWPTQADCIAAFIEGRQGMKSWLTTVTADLRQFGAPHPRLGLLDAVQWLLFEAAHTERHTRQMLELKEVAGYPLGGV